MANAAQGHGNWARDGHHPDCRGDFAHDGPCKVGAAASPRKRLRQLTPTAIGAIEERVSLMRWSSHEKDEEITAGSLADVFWNSDIPRLIRAARRSLDV